MLRGWGFGGGWNWSSKKEWLEGNQGLLEGVEESGVSMRGKRAGRWSDCGCSVERREMVGCSGLFDAWFPEEGREGDSGAGWRVLK